MKGSYLRHSTWICPALYPQLETVSKIGPCYGRLIILMNHQETVTNRIVPGDSFRLSPSMLDKLDHKFQSGLVPHMPRSTHANKGLLQVNLGQVAHKPFWHRHRWHQLLGNRSNPGIATIHKCSESMHSAPSVTLHLPSLNVNAQGIQ